jgi:hypothetical protein
VLSQVQAETRRPNTWTRIPVESLQSPRKEIEAESDCSFTVFAEATSLAPQTASTRVYARGLEFVALPGTSEELQTAIPLALREAGEKLEGFCGCMVLFSEQEARLVTVITLWTGENASTRCNQDSNRLAKRIEPYVDRWLRTRSFNTFLSTP